MTGKIIVLFFLISNAVCEDCKVFNFENGMDDLENFIEVCNSLAEWSWNEYTSISPIPMIYENSTAFIEPAASPSCTSTGLFSMSGGGLLEINVYIQSTTDSEIISAVVNQVTADGQHQFVTNNLVMAATLENDWFKWSIPISGSSNYNAYLALITNEKSDGSIILIDSLRYIPPGVSEEVCRLYDDGNDTTEEPVTEFPVTDEPEIDEPATDEPEIDEPATDESVTDEPATDEPATDEPATNEPATDEPATDEPATDEPATGEPATDEPITDEPVTDEPGTEDASETPIIEGPSNPSFWNPFTISMVVILVIIAICIVSLTFYELGKRNANNDNETIILDVEEIPPVRVVPRVNKVHNKDSFWY